MTILTVGSTNPNFSFVISKNPATIRESNKPFTRSLRKGAVYGWFTKPDDSEFRLWFKDHEHQSSFAEGHSEEFEYLDKSRYGSPYAPIAIITECLGSVSKELHELEVPTDATTTYQAYATANILVSSHSFLNGVTEKFGEGVEVKSQPLVGQGKYYQVTVIAPTVHKALNVLQTVCIQQALADKGTYVPMNEAALLKFAKVFNRAESPYYPRYLFKMAAIPNRDTFDKIKSDLEGPGMQFVYGNTQFQRFDAVKHVLKENPAPTLFDIGCGEMFYSLRFTSIYDTVYAVDSDEDSAVNNIGKVKGRAIENVVALHAEANPEWVKDQASLIEGSDILMVEVMEHTEETDSWYLLTSILEANPKRVVVTVPNKSFNDHYGLLPDEFRHPDHKWEPTFQEFSDDVVIVAAACNYDVSIYPIGDVVDDVSVGTMAVFTKKKELK